MLQRPGRAYEIEYVVRERRVLKAGAAVVIDIYTVADALYEVPAEGDVAHMQVRIGLDYYRRRAHVVYVVAVDGAAARADAVDGVAHLAGDAAVLDVLYTSAAPRNLAVLYHAVLVGAGAEAAHREIFYAQVVADSAVKAHDDRALIAAVVHFSGGHVAYLYAVIQLTGVPFVTAEVERAVLHGVRVLAVHGEGCSTAVFSSVIGEEIEVLGQGSGNVEGRPVLVDPLGARPVSQDLVSRLGVVEHDEAAIQAVLVILPYLHPVLVVPEAPFVSPRCALLSRGQHGLRPLAIGGQGYIAVGVIEIQVATVCAAALEKHRVAAGERRVVHPVERSPSGFGAQPVVAVVAVCFGDVVGCTRIRLPGDERVGLDYGSLRA